MQKGFATLEIILSVLIVALLAGAALPNAVRVLEKVSLDYETKRLYSELRFAQALSRDSAIEKDDVMVATAGYGKINPSPGATVTIDYSNRPNSWQVRLGTKSSDPLLREVHPLRHGEIFSLTNDSLKKISFDSTGQPKNENDKNADGTLTLTSRTGKYKSKIIFNSVGRILVGTEHD